MRASLLAVLVAGLSLLYFIKNNQYNNQLKRMNDGNKRLKQTLHDYFEIGIVR